MAKLVQPSPYALLRAQINNPQEKAGLPSERPPVTVEQTPETAPATPIPAKVMQRPAPEAAPVRRVYKFRVPVPARQSSAEFAKLVEAYGETDAVGMILKSALDEWISTYSEKSRIHDKPQYVVNKRLFATTKRFDETIVADIKRRIDPHDRRTDSFIAQRIAVSALSEYLTRH